MKVARLSAAPWIGVAFLLLAVAGPVRAEVVRADGYELYVPGGLENGRRVPLVLVLSPTGDTEAMWTAWFPVVRKRRWFLMGSTRYTNERLQPFEPWVKAIGGDLKAVTARYPIDSRYIIAGGLSGGGSASYMLAYTYPTVISAVVANTGRIWEVLDGELPAFVRREETRKRQWLPASAAVLLASPTDFRYKDMQDDLSFLTRAGWRTKWIEFPGGHELAPESAYEDAVQWLSGQLGIAQD